MSILCVYKVNAANEIEKCRPEKKKPPQHSKHWSNLAKKIRKWGENMIS